MWWLLYKTTFGFEIRTVGANRDAARYAGINITRNVVMAMAISGALAGLAGAIEIIGLARVLQSFFSAGYGFESIAIALLANSHPLGTIPAALLFGALRNGADLMELRSGVSKQMIAVVQGLIVMFVAAPGVIRWIYHIKAPRGEKACVRHQRVGQVAQRRTANGPFHSPEPCPGDPGSGSAHGYPHRAGSVCGYPFRAGRRGQHRHRGHDVDGRDGR